MLPFGLPVCCLNTKHSSWSKMANCSHYANAQYSDETGYSVIISEWHLLHYMAHCSTLFFTIEKIKMKNHSSQNIIFKQIWTFLDNLTKIRKKSVKKTFFSQWKKQLFHTVKKIFNSLWKKHLIHCEKNNCFTVWKKQLFKKLS